MDTNVAGRSVFKNAGATQRNGLELAAESDLTRGFFAYASYTYLRATFEDAFVSNGNVVAKGNQIPGVPRSSLYVDLGWRHAESGFFSAIENRWVSKVFANDTNANWADSYQTMDLRLGVNRNIEGFAVQAFMRANNLLGEKYIGAVAVNDGNGYFYAPAPERNFLFGASVSRQF